MLSEDAELRAREFVTSSEQLWAIVYDNINFTLQKASQHLDSDTQQINATTLAIFSLPQCFTRKAYASALSIYEHAKLAGGQQSLKLVDLVPSEESQKHLHAAFKHAICDILLSHTPGKMRKQRKT